MSVEPPRSMAQRSVANLRFDQHDEVRIGLIGAGNRQGGLVANLAPVPHARVTAIADPKPEAIGPISQRLEARYGTAPAELTGPGAVDRLVARDDVDLVMVATPWTTHTELAVRAMRAGKHVAIEVPAAVTLGECWQLVETSEETQRHCVMLENCCYGEMELLALRMVRAGAFGHLLHAEGSYVHDLRAQLMHSRDWRRRAHIEHDGNLYPTHGLGPVASYFDINRGDRFTRLVSMGSPSLGLQEWRKTHLAPDDPRQRENYRCADINTSMIQTAQGRTVVLQHHVVGPRPYDRRNQVVGTNGTFTDYPPRIYLEDDPVIGTNLGRRREDESDDLGHAEYRGVERYREAFQHPLWRTEREAALAAGGHGGMDYLMLLRLIQAMREGRTPDMDVYDAATWSAPAALSETSVESGSAPVEFPDFTRGNWSVSRPGIP